MIFLLKPTPLFPQVPKFSLERTMLSIMTLQTFANIVGILAILAYLPLLVNGPAAVKFYKVLVKNETFMRLVGALSVVLTVLVLKDGYIVGKDPAGLLTLVVWLGLVKGILCAWYPAVPTKHCTAMLSNTGIRPLIAIAGLAVGVLILYGATLV